MLISRRSLLGVGTVAVAGAIIGGRHWSGAPAFIARAAAQPAPAPLAPDDPRMTERAIGKADAPVTVAEWFSLTCPHCARFSADVLPQIQTRLVDTGKLRMVFNDFPLDVVALTAAMVARSLPPERYEPFCAALLASQDRWAFARGVNSTEELAKMAALAGMSRDNFNAAIANTALRDAILKKQDDAGKTLHVDSTPTFIINGPAAHNQSVSGEQSFDDFAALVAKASG
jgi:protein-disulfide isomerase